MPQSRAWPFSRRTSPLPSGADAGGGRKFEEGPVALPFRQQPSAEEEAELVREVAVLEATAIEAFGQRLLLNQGVEHGAFRLRSQH